MLGVLETPDKRPPPSEFAEWLYQYSKTWSEKDATKLLLTTAERVSRAEVFEFGEIKEPHLIREGRHGGEMMQQGLLETPYESCVFWHTLSDLLYVENRGSFVMNNRLRYATVVTQLKGRHSTDCDDFTYYIAADFVRVLPQVVKEIDHPTRKGATYYGCLGVGVFRPSKTDRWTGSLILHRENKSMDTIIENETMILGSIVDTITSLSMILATKNVGLRVEKASEKVNKKREKKGKPPYPAVTYVDVQRYMEAAARSATAGTHASPIPHLRRGHIRNYRNGGRSWVRPALVNCRSLKDIKPRDHYEVLHVESEGA